MKIDMTSGSISKKLFKMAIPVMATSFLQMAYNLVDMIWIGRIGSKAVAAVGTAGFYMWLSMAFILIAKVGSEVRVSQSIGAKNYRKAKEYAENSIYITVVLAIIYGILCYIFREQLIGFFNIGDAGVEEMGRGYLAIISLGSIFSFLNPVFTGIFTGYGDSKIPFYINAIGLVSNMLLDPLLIFVLKLGVNGAALATVMSQCIVAMIFVYLILKRRGVVKDIKFNRLPCRKTIQELFKLGIPVALNSGFFTLISMIIARIIAEWGPVPIAVQKVGSQIEAISWMTASGFQVALATFVGQNYGANQGRRIVRGYKVAMQIMLVIGILATLLLILGAKPIFSVFIPEEESIRLGIDYLVILGYSQWFMCIEIVTGGAFNGMGRTSPPSIISIFFNLCRIPLAIYLSTYTNLGLDGIWWSISISSVFKGVILVGWFLWVIKKERLNDMKGV